MHSIPKPFPSPERVRNLEVTQHTGGFSLVEVSASIGIMAFAFVALLGLLSGGLGHFREAIDRTVTAQIAARVINDAQQSEFPALIGENASRGASGADTTGMRYFDEQGNEIVPASEDGLSPAERRRVIYHVGTRIRARAEVPRESAAATPDLAQITVQVAHYSGIQPLMVQKAPGASENLLKAPLGAPVFTYSALVARVQ